MKLQTIDNNKELVYEALKNEWVADKRDRLVTDCIKFDEYCEKYCQLKITVDFGFISIEQALKGAAKAYVLYFSLYELTLEFNDIESHENYELVRESLNNNIDANWSEYYIWIRERFHHYISYLEKDTDIAYLA
ncbi:TPA: hypothetical protein L4R04_005969 [Pseudomonas aeruginosa]|nr:hypothetical protein [Pseudomonas aeruginosa]